MAGTEVVILMGSASDWKHMSGATEILTDLGVTFTVHVSSAHRTPDRTVDIVRSAEAEGCRVFVCGAGMAAHLAGVVAAHTVRPVLGVPLPGGAMDGLDALLSTVQMPGGVPVATFAIGSAGARNAAFFAAQIVAGERAEVAENLRRRRHSDAAKVEAAEAEIRTHLAGGSA